jgi:hypothetical protein
MTERSTMTTKTIIDWEAAARAAGELGIQTRQLVWRKDADGAREFALKMAAAHNHGNVVRASSYLELAVLLGYSPPPQKRMPKDDERLVWIQAELTSTKEKLKALEDVLARTIADHDRTAQAAAEAKKAKAEDAA